MVGKQHSPDNGNSKSKKEEISYSKWRIHLGGEKVCVNFKTDTDKLNVVVKCCRYNSYLKCKRIDLKFSHYQSLLAKCVFLLGYIDKFYTW